MADSWVRKSTAHSHADMRIMMIVHMCYSCSSYPSYYSIGAIHTGYGRTKYESYVLNLVQLYSCSTAVLVGFIDALDECAQPPTSVCTHLT